MCSLESGFAGFGEPTSPEEKVTKLEPEPLDLTRFALQESLRLRRETAQFERILGGAFIGIAVIVLAVVLLLGSQSGDYLAAEKWWGFVAAPVGYLLHVIFARRQS